MNFKIISIIIVVIMTGVSFSDSAKILGLFTSRSKSHLIVHMSVAKALIERGHDLTVVTTVDLNESNKNYRHIKVPGLNYENVTSKLINAGFVEKFLNIKKSFNVVMQNSKVALQSDEIKKLMAEESFDLVLLGYFVNEYEVGVAAHFKCPSIIIWMLQPVYVINTLIGNPSEIAHVPNPMWIGNSDTGFISRLKNVLIYIFENIFWWSVRRNYNTYYEELFPPEKYPSFEEALKNVSLVLSNYHFSQGPIKADVPSLIQIGGIQIDEKIKPLPEDIQKHLDGAGKDGAILFSLGSMVKSTDIGQGALKILFKVLSSLKQKVIWKWETGELPGNSKNILFKKWFPQNSVLAHPNLKLFITHGGKGSVVESEYFGVPMIGLPVFADQPLNVNEFVAEGFGLRLDHQTISEEDLRNTINEILTNTKYRENVKRFSNLFRDRPMTPKETVVYWVEYVLRHNGGKHMQSPAVHIPFYQLMGLDVMAFLGVVLYLVFKIIKFLCKILWKVCCYVFCCKCFRTSIKNCNNGKLKSKKE